MSRHRILALVVALTSGAASLGVAAVPDAVPALPVLGPETLVGSLAISATAPVAPTPKSVDGDASDWTGSITRLGGTAVYSRGEYVYQDFLGDAWGADDGFDAQRKQTLDAIKDAEPRTYRLDALQQAGGAQFDAPQPVGAQLHYGDTTAAAGVREQADIEEVRVAAGEDHLLFLVRTLAMSEAPKTAVLILLDTEPGGSYTLAPSLGGITTAAEWAYVISATRGRSYYRGLPTPIPVCPPSGCIPEIEVGVDSSGFANTMEIAVRQPGIGLRAAPVGIGVATGIASADGFAATKPAEASSDLINVAFRREPARIWMDERQALALRDGAIDSFLAPVSPAALIAGRTETYTQRPGYYEAVYVDAASPVNREETTNAYFQGPYQHYGLYLPSAYRAGSTYPAMFWMHYRGGHAHDAAAWEPGILRDFGDGAGAIVVTPSARGESSWYTGRGMVDFLDVWDDATARVSIDADRVWLGGHSMGGWASWLLGLLFPDRWAASNPEDGLLAPGLWAGAGDPVEPQQGADVQAEFLYPLLENARNLPYAILHGTADELVPVSSAVAAGARLHELGYRYRTYLYHAYEHYSAPIWDDWREMVSYMTQFRRDRDPARVTYKIKPALDHAVSTVSVPAGVDLGFTFNRAYWVSGLATRTPGIDPSNIGGIDATTFGRGVPSALGIPEAGAGVFGPYTMTGQRWLATGSAAAANRFEATLTNLSAATLDLARMAIGTSAPITASVTSDGPATLRLQGTWPDQPVVTGAAVVSYDGSTLTLGVASGTSAITIS